MKKITREEFASADSGLSWGDLWNHIDSLQSELEALEGRKGQSWMTEQDTKFLHWVADRFVVVYHEKENTDFVHKIRSLAGPLPPKVTRERTTQQLAKEYVDKMVGGGNRADAYLILVEKLENGEKLKDLCTAVGISLTEEA